MRVIQFSKIRFYMIAVSVIVILGGVAGTVAQGGFNLGIDFQAGLSMRVQVGPEGVSADTVQVRSALSSMDGVQVQTVGEAEAQQFIIRVQDRGEIQEFGATMSGEIMSLLAEEFGASRLTELENYYVGPRFSQDLVRNMIILITSALALILVYIWFRFKLDYALSAIVALLHDVAFMVVFIGVFQVEVSTATVAAVLTIIGYSLNDTIVIFDRIRENEKVMRESNLETIINTSVSQSLSRTLITSLTTLLAVLAIFIFATGTVQTFALNLIVGVVIGTYSSVFVASPVLLGLRRGRRKRATVKQVTKAGGEVTDRHKEEAKSARPADEAKVKVPDAGKVLQELGRKKAGSGKNVPRSKRKKK
jgi:preprotein translocase subunit SecF